MSTYKILHQGNGVFKCKSQGSHKWTRGGQQLGLTMHNLVIIAGTHLHSRNLGLCTWCCTEERL